MADETDSERKLCKIVYFDEGSDRLRANCTWRWSHDHD